jgi:hypothetical protein
MLLKKATDAGNARINASWPLHHSGDTKVLCGCQNPAFTATLGGARRPLFDGASRVHERCPVELRWIFFSSLFSLSFLRKTHMNFQKSNCLLRFVILLILILLLLITLYLAFDTF